MTKNESFKRRIRERMEKTGERYNAARRALIEQAPTRKRQWISEPEMTDDAVRKGTGRGWDAWCDIIDAWPDNSRNHPEIVAYLQAHQGLDGWWSQSVTVGYERITGLRLPGQMADGTFTANKSKTVVVDASLLLAMLLDDSQRDDLFPGYKTTLRSRAGAKVPRVEVGPGVANIGVDQLDDGRAKVTIQHSGLPAADDVDEWKHYWTEWLAALDGATVDG